MSQILVVGLDNQAPGGNSPYIPRTEANPPFPHYVQAKAIDARTSTELRVDNECRRGVRGDPVHGGHRGFHRQRVVEHHHSRAEHQRLSGDAGAVTVEAAFAIAALVSVLVVCLAGLDAVVLQIRCVDAAREAARLAARGDDGVAAAQRVGPAGAVVSVRREGALLVARVSARSALLPGVAIGAEAVSVAERGR